jgi:tetratricopeptide (TPR) repeat protein
LREAYCSVDCQKGDWKAHKSTCKILKKLSHQHLQSYYEVVGVIEETLREKIVTEQQRKRVLQHLISYAVHQFGDRIAGKAYRERGNGEGIDNWFVEIGILIPIYVEFLFYYQYDSLLSVMDCDNLIFPYFEKILELLRPWSAYLDLSRSSRIGNLDKDQINRTSFHFSQTEWNIARVYIRRNQFDLAKNHCQQALFYARMYEGEEEVKTDLLCKALIESYVLHTHEGNYDEALIFAEEAYNCVAIAYNPVHPKVQEAASKLIECLIYKGDFDKAETFAQMTLDSLKDPGNGLDQQSETVAKGYYGLGSVITQQKRDLVKAEKLVRESLRIRSHLFDTHHQCVGVSAGLLASILQAQGNLGSETQELHERALVIYIRNYGSEGVNTAVSNYNMGGFYHLRAEESQTIETKKENLLLSESKYKESLRIYTTIYSPDYPRTLETSFYLSIISHKLSEV